MTAVEKNQPTRSQVVAKALINLKDELSLSGETVGKIIGADSSTISRITKNMDMQENRSFEAAILLIRVYRSLYAMLGGSSDAMKHWLVTENIDFNMQPPLEAMKTIVGLVDVAQYLDAMCGSDRILSPVEKTWDSFFLSSANVSGDFIDERASQDQAQRESFDD